MPSWMYILRLTSGKLYIGSTRNREQRCKAHFADTGCRTTKLDPPIAIAYQEELPSYPESLCRERQVKGWTHAKKEALIASDLIGLRLLAKRKNGIPKHK